MQECNCLWIRSVQMQCATYSIEIHIGFSTVQGMTNEHQQSPHNGNPQISQSRPPWVFSKVQCGQMRMLPLPPPVGPGEGPLSRAIWSKTSGGMSVSIGT